MAVSGAEAVHVILLTTSLISSPSSVFTGVLSLVVPTAAVQPGIGIVDTDAIGLSVGIATSSFVVEAVSLSVGTRKAIRAKLPGPTGSLAFTVTWALAAEAKPSTATVAAAAEASTVRTALPMKVSSGGHVDGGRHGGLVEVRDPQGETELPGTRTRQRHRAGGMGLGQREDGYVDGLDALCRQRRAHLPLLHRQGRALRGERVEVHLVVSGLHGFDVELELVQLGIQGGGVDALVGFVRRDGRRGAGRRGLYQCRGQPEDQHGADDLQHDRAAQSRYPPRPA